MYSEPTKEQVDRLIAPCIDQIKQVAVNAYMIGFRDAEEKIYEKAEAVMKTRENERREQP